jgi:hypothetical protein
LTGGGAQEEWGHCHSSLVFRYIIAGLKVCMKCYFPLE